MIEQHQLQKKLFQSFQEMKLNNPRYSLRAFSGRLGLGAGAVSQIMNGKRKVSLKMAEKICDRLLLDPQDRSELLSLFEKRSLLDHGAIPKKKYQKLTQDQFLAISQWHHFAILSLLKTKGAKNSAAWFADRIGIAPKDASDAIKRLISLKIIERASDGTLKRINPFLRTNDDIADLSLRAHHMQTIRLAEKALSELDVKIRDFTTITFPVSLRSIKKAKEMIRTFQDQLSEKLEYDGEDAEVYRLSMEFFPLTKIKEKK